MDQCVGCWSLGRVGLKEASWELWKGIDCKPLYFRSREEAVNAFIYAREDHKGMLEKGEVVLLLDGERLGIEDVMEGAG